MKKSPKGKRIVKTAGSVLVATALAQSAFGLSVDASGQGSTSWWWDMTWSTHTVSNVSYSGSDNAWISANGGTWSANITGWVDISGAPDIYFSDPLSSLDNTWTGTSRFGNENDDGGGDGSTTFSTSDVGGNTTSGTFSCC